jgi:hypothetical protein
MIFRFFRSASSISSSACADVEVNGFLDEHVLAVLERGLRELEVRPDRRHDRDGVDVGDRSTSAKSVVSEAPG